MDRRQRFYALFFYFLAYSFLGWFYEVFLEVVVYRWGFGDRGVMVGPYCIIYGVGALIFIASLSGLKERRITCMGILVTPLLVFLGIVFITTSLELAGSYIMEWTRGNWMWDYHSYAFNFQGRIALNPSVRFGLGGLLIMYGIQPQLEKLVARWSPKAFQRSMAVIGVVFLLDALYTFVLSKLI